MDLLDGAELELVCACGFENFERIVVERRPNSPLVTDFVACVGCRAMYHSPVRAPTSAPKGPSGQEQKPARMLATEIVKGFTQSRSMWGKVPGPERVPMTDDEQARFDAKVQAANKSKRKR